jgi:phosphoenolpyruvate---glycerone phosphotransferase subunit DhaL
VTMETGLNTESIRWAAARFRQVCEKSATELNELDASIGDGDLGVTLARTGGSLVGDLASAPEDVGMAFLRCAQTFSRVSAGTYGTLLATGLMAVAKATKGRTVIPWNECSSLLEIALKAMAERGKSQLGDKTVLDALDAARQATAGLDEPGTLVRAADYAIEAAIEQFREVPFRQGRARMFGSKGGGRDDPGMIAFKRIVEGLSSGLASETESHSVI